MRAIRKVSGGRKIVGDGPNIISRWSQMIRIWFQNGRRWSLDGLYIHALSLPRRLMISHRSRRTRPSDDGGCYIEPRRAS